MGRPLIGIAPHLLKTKSKRILMGTYTTYVHAVTEAGGDCIVLAPNALKIPRYLELLDGLLLTGGGDIHPKYFGQKPYSGLLELSPETRTRFELKLLKAFLRKHRPVLGVCLGCQTLNVAMGGTLLQDIPSQVRTKLNHRKGRHHAAVLPHTKLRRILGKSAIVVNTYHHQSVDRLAPGLRIAARAPDQVVEAVEDPRRRFVLGVQWHPEELPTRRESKKIFRAFIRACRSR